jgi:hypothetical protein
MEPRSQLFHSMICIERSVIKLNKLEIERETSLHVREGEGVSMNLHSIFPVSDLVPDLKCILFLVLQDESK